MNTRSRWLFSRPRAAALALAASVVWMGAPAAQAQLFNWDSALPPAQVERMIQASGYRLTGPVIRHGPVYLADVLGRDNDAERLIIDAKEGRLLQRFPAATTRRQAVASSALSSPPPQMGASFGWFSRDDDAAAPRPPAAIEGETWLEPRQAAPIAPAHAPTVKEVARTDDAPGPHVIMAPNGAPAAATLTPLLEKPRLRPQVKRKKFEPTPVAQPATAPGDGKPAPLAQPAAVPSVAAPAASDAAGAAPHVAETKAAPASAPATAAIAPAAPAPRAPAAKPAINDVPVAPLE